MAHHCDPTQSATWSGGCLCGSVTFEIRGPIRQVVACHCRQCRRWHGHFAAYVRTRVEHMTFLRDDSLRWYQSSSIAMRGYCGECGSSLFWRPSGSADISVAVGSLDDPSGLKLVGHIFCADKPDYYAIDDKKPRYPASSTGAFENMIVPANENTRQPPR